MSRIVPAQSQGQQEHEFDSDYTHSDVDFSDATDVVPSQSHILAARRREQKQQEHEFDSDYSASATDALPTLTRTGVYTAVDTSYTVEPFKRAAVRKAIMLFAMSAEFNAHVGSAGHHSSSTTGGAVQQQRSPQPDIPSQGRPYKALVVMYLAGGVDSWNLIVPKSGCTGGRDLFADYTAARGLAALSASQLQSVTVSSGQPCTTFGVHEHLPNIKRMFDAGDASFVANVGNLVEPIADRNEFDAKTKRRPSSLYAHNVQQSHSESVNAGAFKTKGVIGRMVEALSSQSNPYRVASYSLSGNRKITEGARPATILSAGSGAARWTGYRIDPELQRQFIDLVGKQEEGIFAETHSSSFEAAVNASEALGAILDSVTIDTTFTKHATVPGGEGDKITEQLSQVAKVIKSRADRGNAERDIFLVRMTGWDTHNSNHNKVQELFQYVDHALGLFETEMNAQGLWNSVALVEMSEFGRTLRSNGKGTDHAWAGNVFFLGGAVNGGQILGQYPSRVDDEGPLNVRSGGRLIPTTSWEMLWNGIALWFGVDSTRMSEVLPGMNNFPAASLFSSQTMFSS